MCVQDIDRLLSTFAPDGWSFLHFWKDGHASSQPTRLEPPPGLAPRPSNSPDAPMGHAPNEGPTLILDEEMPAGHHLVQPTAPVSVVPRPSELGGGSLQPLGGESPPPRGNTQPNNGNETAPSRRQTIKTTVKHPPKPRPDKERRFSLDPCDKPPKNAKDDEMPEEGQ